MTNIAEERVRALLDAFETQDLEIMRQSFHPEATFELPFEDRFETKSGVDDVMAHFARCFDPDNGLFRTLVFDVQALFHDPDEDAIVVQYTSRGVLREFEADYENSYVGVLRIQDGVVARWQEYANPLKGTSRRLEALRQAVAASPG